MIAENIPNVLTLARILLLPFFAITLIYGLYQYALILFVTASVTDLLDGFVARLKKQITAFGSILDPVADKFLLITSFIIMSVNGWIPKWLTIIIISRDLIIITGWLIIYLVTHNPKVEPSILGKSANSLQFILVGLTLLSINFKEIFLVPDFFLIIVAVVTTISGISYIYRGLKTVNTET